jgi:hypothetical protein
VTSVSVVAGGVVANVPLAPDAGAVKVTETPLTGLPPFVTVATNGPANAVVTIALCPPPLVAVITMAGGTTAVFVRAKLAGVAAPEVEAVTEYAPVTKLAVNI